MIPANALTRLGTESAFKVLARAAEIAAAGRPVINLGIGQPDFPTPPHIVEAGIKALRDGHHGYTPAKGILPLREAVAADILARRGVEISPERVLVMPGGKPTMFFAIQMFGEPGAEIVYPDPGFPIYGSAINFTGAKGVGVAPDPAIGLGTRAADILAAITPKTRLLIVNSPNNPTGGVMPKAEVDALVDGLAKWPDLVILSDEIYSRMAFDAPHVSLLSYPEIADRVILLDGWSKTYAMTGWRLGYGVWPEPLVDLAERLAVNNHSCVNASAQFAGIAALEGPQDCVDEMVSAFERRRRLVVDALNALPGITCPEPGGAFYAFPDIGGSGMDAMTAQTRLLEEQAVATIAGSSFGANGDTGLRFSYANSEENIAEGVARFGALL